MPKKLHNFLGVWLVCPFCRPKVFHRSKCLRKFNGGPHSWDPPLFSDCYFTSPFVYYTHSSVWYRLDLCFWWQWSHRVRTHLRSVLSSPGLPQCSHTVSDAASHLLTGSLILVLLALLLELKPHVVQRSVRGRRKNIRLIIKPQTVKDYFVKYMRIDGLKLL